MVTKFLFLKYHKIKYPVTVIYKEIHVHIHVYLYMYIYLHA